MLVIDDRPGVDADPRPTWPDEGVSRVPHWLYTDEGVYRRELERIFAGPAWSYVALEAEIPAPGDHLLSAVGDTEVIVARDRSGEVNVLVNRCAHRGVALCSIAGPTSARHLTCPYHQWRYGLDGTLLGVPFRKGVQGNGGMPPDFDPARHGLVRLRVARRHGVVFATHSRATPPLEDFLGPEMLTWFDRVFAGRPLRILGRLRQRIPANWKLMLENIKDPYHASLLHVFLVTFGLFRADQPSEVRMDASGAHAVLVSRRATGAPATTATVEMASYRADLRLADARLLDPVPEFPGDATVVMQTIWPNLIVQQQSNTLATRQIVVRGPGSFDLNWTFFGYADDNEAMVMRRLRQANLMGPAGLVSVDDSEVLALAQRGCATTGDDGRDGGPGVSVVEMGGRGTDGAPHMVTEAALRAFYRHYREVMDL